MAERTIVGVDFSGREKRNTTEVTMAVLRGDVLELKPYQALPKTLPATHIRLIERLKTLPADAVVALDFPFSVPWLFARELASINRENIPSKMPDLWSTTAQMCREEFDNLRISFIERHGELHRQGDLYLDGPLSPLNQRMWVMTFRGMRMLYHLWECDIPRFRVPPLPNDGRDGPILLETMPGILLRVFGLPATNYKGKNKTNRGESKNVRYEILEGLEQSSPVILRIPDDTRQQCINNDNCLDSLVAAVGAAMWVQNPGQFRKPKPKQKADVELEGWIYAPER